MRGLKKGAFCLLAVCLLLASCGEKAPDAKTYEALKELYLPLCEEERLEIDFMTEASFKDASGEKTGVLYFLSGSGSFDRASGTLWQDLHATLLGESVREMQYYADGVRTSVNGEDHIEENVTAEEIFSGFPYGKIPLPPLHEVKTLTVESNGTDSVLYTLVTDVGQERLVKEVWNLDLYTLAGISVPDTDKEKYGNATYAFSVKNGRVTSLTVTVPMDIYAKSGYTPGYTQKDEDRCLHLTVCAKIEFKKSGSDVSVPIYEPSESEESAEP